MARSSITSIDEFNRIIQEKPAVLFYFSTTSCSVGESILPKIKFLYNKSFPKIDFCEIDMNDAMELSAFCQVFVEPTILIYFDCKETLRRSRNLSLIELEEATTRLYKLFFTD
ncbi:thioredoxin family protein [Namhaeicola litoreus]|uniref:Thioredoxin family protein n=1 Tax=Namhaeicola litoreus TaxID=1052145 RepID=A0ABW3Y3W1_9FLAO